MQLKREDKNRGDADKYEERAEMQVCIDSMPDAQVYRISLLKN